MLNYLKYEVKIVKYALKMFYILDFYAMKQTLCLPSVLNKHKKYAKAYKSAL